MIPIHLGSPGEFSMVREFLQHSGFTFDEICRRFEVKPPCEFTQIRPGPDLAPASDTVELLLRLFMLGTQESLESVSALIPVDVLLAMSNLGLLVPSPERNNCMVSPVGLCALDAQYFVSDRWNSWGDAALELSEDTVYPACTLNTQRFLKSVSYSHCESLLDLCSGTGVAAMLGAKYARNTWAADVTERSAYFAEFNKRLNGLENVNVVRGDLYDAVPGMTFDQIIAHPPFVPVQEPRWAFYDGGSDGELVTHRIVEGLPAHLRPGGTFQCHALVSDRELKAEERIRSWLGEASKEFDLLIVIWRQVDAASCAAELALKGNAPRLFETWKATFASLKIESVLDLTITLQRHLRPGVPLTIRRTGTERAAAAEAEWLLVWEKLSSMPDANDAILRARPIMSPFLHLETMYNIQQGRVGKRAARATVPYPYNVEAALDEWMPGLIASCDGHVSVAELLSRLVQEGRIPADTPPQKFGALLAMLVSRGIVYVEEFPPPALSHD